MIVERLLSNSGERETRRRHPVRGHWRQIEYGKRMPFRCDHTPTMVEDGIGICTRCERMVRWIKPTVKGDASKGWVNHTYVVDAS
jgi:hypothetical protein